MAAPDAMSLDVCALEIARDNRCLLTGLDLVAPRGQLLVIAGPSGAGKTSLLACLAGLLEPVSGSVSYAGHSPAAFRARLGLVFQHLLLTPNATAETNALCGLLGKRGWWQTLFGFGRVDRVRAAEIFDRLELSACGQKPIRHLSGGERQRVAIARALLPGPDVLLADEPVSHLDPRLARQVLSFLRDEARASGRAVLCVLHDQGLTEEFADAVLTLRKDSPRDWNLATR